MPVNFRYHLLLVILLPLSASIARADSTSSPSESPSPTPTPEEHKCLCDNVTVRCDYAPTDGSGAQFDQTKCEMDLQGPTCAELGINNLDPVPPSKLPGILPVSPSFPSDSTDKVEAYCIFQHETSHANDPSLLCDESRNTSCTEVGAYTASLSCQFALLVNQAQDLCESSSLDPRCALICRMLANQNAGLMVNRCMCDNGTNKESAQQCAAACIEKARDGKGLYPLGFCTSDPDYGAERCKGTGDLYQWPKEPEPSPNASPSHSPHSSSLSISAQVLIASNSMHHTAAIKQNCGALRRKYLKLNHDQRRTQAQLKSLKQNASQFQKGMRILLSRRIVEVENERQRVLQSDYEIYDQLNTKFDASIKAQARAALNSADPNNLLTFADPFFRTQYNFSSGETSNSPTYQAALNSFVLDLRDRLLENLNISWEMLAKSVDITSLTNQLEAAAVGTVIKSDDDYSPKAIYLFNTKRQLEQKLDLLFSSLSNIKPVLDKCKQ